MAEHVHDSEARNAAQTALFAAITETVTKTSESGVNSLQRAHALKELAFVYRLVVGGPQPGSVEVSAK